MTVAKIPVGTSGVLEVLSVGGGDVKIVLDGEPDDIWRGGKMIEDMIQRGYGIFVKLEDDTYARVTDFDPKQMTYYINAAPEGENDAVSASGDGAAEAAVPVTPKRGGRGRRAVPVEGSEAVAVGRTAGG